MKQFLLLIIIIISFRGYSQVSGTAFFLRTGYNYISHAASKLSQVDPNGLYGFSEHFFAVGLDGYLKENKLLVGMDLMVAGQDGNGRGTTYSQPFTSAGHIKAGYTILERPYSWVYPTVGLGLSSLSLTNYSMDGAYKYGFSKVFQMTPSIDFGLNCDFIVRQACDKNILSALMAGARIGYRMSAGSHQWKKYKGQNEEQPRFTNNVYYAIITVGVGNFLKNKK